MAPIRPKSKRPSIRSRTAKVAPPTPSTAQANLKADYHALDSRITKKDKRTLKHVGLMKKVREAGINKPAKRRRPGKKLAADIGGLEDALPDMENDEEWVGLSDEEGEDGTPTQKKRRRKRTAAAGHDGKMVMKSLKLRQGAMKRKRAMEESEKVRFGRNLAQLAQTQTSPYVQEDAVGDSGRTQERWKALRAFIGGTLEKNAAFAVAGT